MEPTAGRICLCMIVKNESAIIRRCLDSVVEIADYVYIEDTGSTDNTKSMISEWSEHSGIHTVVLDTEWVNFGHNRSMSASNAITTFPEADYLLFLDADMVLENHGLDKASLESDCYSVRQYTSALEYMNIRLVSTKFKWKSMGATHEYWEADGVTTKSTLNTLIIDDRADGGSKDDKFPRDYKLLTDGIEDPDTSESLRTRYYFYLAQTCKDMGKYEESISNYRTRIERGGWEQEVWYSKYQIARCYHRLGKYGLARSYYIGAYNDRPTRAEPLYHLAKMFRKNHDHHMAYCYSTYALSIPKPDDTLFVDHRVYRYLILFELSICAYYCRDVIEGAFIRGKYAATELMDIPDVPDHIKEITRYNMRFYC